VELQKYCQEERCRRGDNFKKGRGERAKTIASHGWGGGGRGTVDILLGGVVYGWGVVGVLERDKGLFQKVIVS